MKSVITADWSIAFLQKAPGLEQSWSVLPCYWRVCGGGDGGWFGWLVWFFSRLGSSSFQQTECMETLMNHVCIYYIYICIHINQTLGQNSAASSLGFPIFVLQKSSSLFPTCQIRFETLWDARPKSTTPRRVAGFWWVEVVSVLGFPKNSFLCLKDTYG